MDMALNWPLDEHLHLKTFLRAERTFRHAFGIAFYPS